MKKLVWVFISFVPFIAFAQDTSGNLSDAEKIYGLSKVWSETKYNFVYYNKLNFDWDSLYQANIPKVLATKSTYDYYRILIRMVAMLDDGHSSIMTSELFHQLLYAPIRANLVEGKVIVTEVSNDTLKDIKIGDEILEINDMNAVDYATKNVAPYVNASSEQNKLVETYYYRLLQGNINEPIKFKIQNLDGKIFTVQFSRKLNSSHSLFSVPQITFKLLKDSIGYLVLNSFNGNLDAYKIKFDSIYSQILKTKSLIIDVRMNSGGNTEFGYYVLSHLVNKPFLGSSWRTREYRPAYRAWNEHNGWSWFGEDADSVPPYKGQLYLKPAVLLTSPVTFSAAEDFCVAFDAAKRGLKIGQPTGGSTGQPLSVSLPGGGSFHVCTKEDTYPDGKKFVGIGIIPDIPVSPTVQSIRSGDDVVLDKAIEVLSK